MTKLFGSSGIRGIVNKDVDPLLATKVGMAVGSLHKSAVIGRDPRTSSEMLNHSLIAGLVATGCDVTDIGVVSTPTLAIAAGDYDCGVMITASHNPAQYGGIKLWNKDGCAFDTTQQNEIERRIAENDFALATWDELGSISSRDDAIESHIKKILESVPKCTLTVVVDCGNGAGSTITPYVLRRMGCTVITLNSQLDGHFPSRNPEPTKENLTMLSQTVVALGADIGIAHDGDADRMMAVERTGRFIPGDELLSHFAIDSNAESIAVPVDTSLLVNKAFGKKVYMTRVGDVYVAEKLKEVGAGFGGEPSGSWIFPQHSLCPDGIYAAAKLVEIVSRLGLSTPGASTVTGVLPPLPTMALQRGKIRLDGAKGNICKTPAQVMDAVGIAVESTEYVDITTIDGIRVDLKDGWFLIRPSGTEPVVRITAESEDVEVTQSIYNLAESVVLGAMK